MKEATGELNMTVVTVVAVAALAAFFYLAIWPTLQSGMILNSACNTSNNGKSSFYQENKDGTKVGCKDKNGASTGSCVYTDKNGKTQSKTCEVAQ